MVMIQEAYVSLETAKLLKEKGFDISTNYSYGNARAYKGRVIDLDTECELKDKGLGGKIKNVMVRYQLWWTKDTDYALPCPTQQMAMSWLREEKSLHIMVDCIGSKNYNPTIQCFDGNDYAVPGEVVSTIKNDEWVKYGFRSNEEAVEAAIQYCLTELL